MLSVCQSKWSATKLKWEIYKKCRACQAMLPNKPGTGGGKPNMIGHRSFPMPNQGTNFGLIRRLNNIRVQPCLSNNR